MDSISINNPEFVNSESYQKFMIENSGSGRLKIRAYAASEALPVGGLKILVSTRIASFQVIFFEGYTDASGMIPSLSLPAPKLEVNNLVAPKSISYKIEAIFLEPYQKKEFFVTIYDNVCVVQNINFVPGGDYGN